MLIFLFLNHQAGLPIEQAGLSWGCRASGSGWSPAPGTGLSVHLSTTYTITYKEHAPAPQHVHGLYVSPFLLSLHIFRYHFSFFFNGKPKGSAKSLQNSVLFQWLQSSMSKLESFASTDRLQAQDGSVEAPSKEQSLTEGSWLLFSKIDDVTKPGVKCTFIEWNTQASDRNLLSLPWPDDSLWFSKTLELWKESQEQNKLPLPSSQSIFA